MHTESQGKDNKVHNQTIISSITYHIHCSDTQKASTYMYTAVLKVQKAFQVTDQ